MSISNAQKIELATLMIKAVRPFLTKHKKINVFREIVLQFSKCTDSIDEKEITKLYYTNKIALAVATRELAVLLSYLLNQKIITIEYLNKHLPADKDIN